MADIYDNSGARNKGLPRLPVGTGGRFRLHGNNPNNTQSVFESLTSRLTPNAMSALQPHMTNDEYGNSVIRMFNQGYTREGEQRETVDFMAGQGGFIGGRNTSNPSSVFGITGIADVHRGAVKNNIQVLSELLNNATADPSRHRSIPALMQNYAFPSLNVGSMTPNMQQKWGSSYLGSTGYEKDAYGFAKPIQAQSYEIAAFKNQGGNLYSGKSSHMFDYGSYAPGGMISNERGESLISKAKRFKNLNVPNAAFERIVGIPTQQTQMTGQLPGQTSPDMVTRTRMAFAMFGVGAEGTQYMDERAGHLATDTMHTVKLDATGTSQFNRISQINDPALRNRAMSETFGFGTGDIFMHKNVNVGAIASNANVRSGMFNRIPGIGQKAGSADFSLIRDVSFDPNTNSLQVALAQYTNLTAGTSKFGKKAQIQPVSMTARYNPLNIQSTGGEAFNVGAVQSMPSPKEAAMIGVNSLRTSFNNDELRNKFTSYAQTRFRLAGGQLVERGGEGWDAAHEINEGVANALYGSGTFQGRAGQILASMGAAHFNQSMQVGFSTAQVSQEQYNTLNKTFEHQGSQYQRYSQPRDLGNGFMEVQQADIYSVLDVGERYQQSYATGKKRFKGAVLDNMAYSHPENYEVLKQIEALQGGNAALRFRQTMNANSNPKLRAQIEGQRNVVDISDLGARDIMNNIPADHPDREGEFMRQLARGSSGSSLVTMNGNLMPSPREALSRVTKDKSGRTISTFGSDYFNAIQAYSAAQVDADLGGEGAGSRQLFESAVQRAMSSGTELANSSAVIESSNAMEIQRTLGGPVGAMPGLQPNEILMSKEDMYNSMGVNQLPENLREDARAKIEHFRGTMPDYFTVGYAMDPNVKPDFQVANLKIVTPEEYMKRPGAQDLPDMGGGRHFLSQTLVKAFGKDFDGDTGNGWMNAYIGRSRKGSKFIRNNTRPTENSVIEGIAALQLAERDTIEEPLKNFGGSADYQREARNAVRAGGEAWSSREKLLESFAGQQASQASIGPTYNTGMKLVEGARLTGDREGAAAMGWIMQAGYQTATKEQVFDDPGFNRIGEIMKTGNYDWSKNPGEKRVSGYIHKNADGSEEYMNFKQDVPTGQGYLGPQKPGDRGSRSISGGLDTFASHIAEGFAQMGSSVGAEEYGVKVAPNLATAMIPRAYRNEKSHNIMTQALVKSQASGDWSGAMGAFSSIVGGQSGILRSVFGSGNELSSGMAAVGGSLVAKTLEKGGPAAQRLNRNVRNLAALAPIGTEARAAIDIKKTGGGGSAHQAAVARSNPLINRHSAAVQQALGGNPEPTQVLSASPAMSMSAQDALPPDAPWNTSAGKRIGMQSRSSYLAGRGGVYTRKKAMESIGASPGANGTWSNVLPGQFEHNDVINFGREIAAGFSGNQQMLDVPFKKDDYFGYDPVNDAISTTDSTFVNDAMRGVMSEAFGLDPSQLTQSHHELFSTLHEFGHKYHMESMGDRQAQEAEVRKWNKSARNLEAGWKGGHISREQYETMYRQQPHEQIADKFATRAIRAFVESGADLVMPHGLSGPQSYEGEMSGLTAAAMPRPERMYGRGGSPHKGRPVAVKYPYSGELSVDVGAAQEIPFGNEPRNPVQTQGERTQAKRATAARVAAAREGNGSAVYIENQEVHNQITNRKFSPTSRADVDELDKFISSGDMQELIGFQSLLKNVSPEQLTPAQQKRFGELTTQHRKAAKALDSYQLEVQGRGEDGKPLPISKAGQAVEGILSTGSNYEQLDQINETDLRKNRNAVQAAFQAGLPDKYQVSGRDLAKGAAGGTGVELSAASGELKELAKNIANVNVVSKEQYQSMQKLTKQYDATEQVVAKLTNLRQRGGDLTDEQQATLDAGKATLARNRGELDTVRETFALASNGAIRVAPDAMPQETRQQLLMEALNAGGIGGARRRSKARDQGLYGSMGEEGDEGGLDYMGRNFQSEGAINAIGGMMRLGNRAGSLLHGMTHLTHNIINPIAGEIQQYGNMELSRSQMLYGVTGQMTGAGNRVLQRQGNLNIARQSASRQVYNTYAGVADMLGGQNMGMLQGIAQSVAAPALSAAVGLQAIGAGAYAGPAALAIGAISAGAWLSGAAGDRNQLAQSGSQTMVNGSSYGNALNTLVTGTGLLFNPQGSKDAGGIVASMQDFESFTRGYDVIKGKTGRAAFGLAKDDPRRRDKNIPSQFADLSISEMISREGEFQRSQGNALTNAEIGGAFFQKYAEGSGKGLSEEQQQGIFSFASMFGGKGSGMLNRLTQGAMSGRTGMQQSIMAQVAATGGSMFNPGAVAAGEVNDQVGLANWIAKGRSAGTYDSFVAENAQWAGQANQLNRFAYGAGKSPLIMADDDRYLDQSWKKDLDIQARTSAMSAAQTNTGAFRGGYGAASATRRQSFVDNLDAVGLGTFNQNEQMGLNYSLQMQARMGGSGLSQGQLLRTANMTQVQGATMANLLSGDAWTTSRLAKQLGNVGLATIDTKTGLGINEYGVSADRLAAYKSADRLGLLNGVSAADVAGGTQGIQRSMELAGREMQMFQFQQGQMQRGVQFGMMTGGGTLNAQGYIQGGNLNSVAQIFQQNGMKFNAGNGMSQWQVEDAGTALSRQQQQFGMRQASQQMAMQWQQFGISGQQWQENRSLQVEQFNYNTQFTREQMNIDRSHQVKQQQWQREDWQYGRNMSELQFGFQMRDADRNIRYSRGRDRLDQMRQRDDAVILHAAEMGQSDKEKNRMTEQQKWSEDQFKRDKDHFEKITDFQKRQMDLEKKHFEQNRAMELQSIQMSQQAHTMSMKWMTDEWRLEDQRRVLDRQGQLLSINMANEAAVRQQQYQVAMNRSSDILQGIGTSLNNIMAQWNADLQTAAGYLNAQMAAGTGGSSTEAWVPSGGGPVPTQNISGGGSSRGGDGGESLSVLKIIASILERIEKNPAVVNAVINTNQSNVAMKNLSLTDLAHGSIH